VVYRCASDTDGAATPVVNRPRSSFRVTLAAVASGAMAIAACGSSGNRPATSSDSQSFVAFSVCMRAHGVPDFPDPNSKGISLSDQPGSDLNPSTPAFQAAQRSCAEQVRLSKFNPTPAQRARATAKLLPFARCVRAHRVPSFPDPSSLGPGQGIGFLIDRNTIDRHSPAVQAALRDCQSVVGGSPGFKSYG
jgi:hypothetical protein